MPEVIRRDPLVPLVAIVSVVVYTLHGFHGALTRDLGLYSYAGQQVADGVLAYLGVLNRAGPLAHVLPGLGVAARAARRVRRRCVTMRVLFLLIATAAVCATYVLGRDLFGSTSGRPRHRGALLAVPRLHPLRLERAAREDADDALRRPRAVGGHPAAVVHRRGLHQPGHAVPADRLLQHLRRRRGGRCCWSRRPAGCARCVRVALGGLAPVAVLGAWFALAGSLRESVDALLRHQPPLHRARPGDRRPRPVWLGLQEAYGVTVWLIARRAAALVLVTLAARRAARAPRVPGAAPCCRR